MVYWSKWVEGCDSDNVVVRNLVNLVHTMNQNGHNVNVHYSSENVSDMVREKGAKIYSVSALVSKSPLLAVMTLYKDLL